MKGFDTETVNRPGGGHACLLTVSDGRYMDFPESFEQIFRFLGTTRDKTDHYFSWNMDFDVRAVIHEKFIPYRHLESLVVLGHCTAPGGVNLEYIPAKFFRASRGHRSVEIYDLAQFYGMRLGHAAERYLKTEKKSDIPRDWYKEMDACLRDSRRETIIKYGLQDAKLVELLGDKLAASFKGLGFEPKRWISPASISVMAFRDSLEHEPKLSYGCQEAFRRSFYGGRIEVQGLGKIRGPLNLYDINSAYPARIATLPGLAGLRVIRSPGGSWVYNPLAVYGSYRVAVEVPPDWAWGPLALKDGTSDEVLFPVGRFETWCGLEALETLREHGVRHNVLDAWEFVGLEVPPPLFPQVPGLYAARQNPVIDLAAKLVLNSWYGKLAECRSKSRVAQNWEKGGIRYHGFQRLKSHEVYGRYTCFPMAAAITEATRLKLWRVLHKFQKRAYMAMTDSVLIRGEIPTAKTLGAWGHKMTVKDAYIFGCGRYHLRGTKKGEPVEDFRFRGFAPVPENLARLKQAHGRTVKVKDLRAESLLEWTREGGTRDLNVLQDVQLDFTLEDSKRFYPRRVSSFQHIFKRFQGSKPWIFTPPKISRKEAFNFG